jgi:hypothetical protein
MWNDISDMQLITMALKDASLSKENNPFIREKYSELRKKIISESNNEPYLKEVSLNFLHKYNPDYGDGRTCECGHPYYRHFDSYENMEACGCKYCGCYEFKEKG